MSFLPVIGAVLSAVGSVVGAVGSMQAANAQATAAEYNAAIQDRNAKAAREQSLADQTDARRKNRRQLGAIKAAYGGSGLTGGSTLDVLEDTALEQELDVARIDYQGKVRAVGYQDQAVLDRMTAKSAKRAGGIAFFGGLLGAGGGFANDMSKALA